MYYIESNSEVLILQPQTESLLPRVSYYWGTDRQTVGGGASC